MAKKRGLKINIKINLTNRWLYTLIAIGILAIVGVGVYAIDTSQAWHSTDQIEGLGTLATKDSVSWTEISNRPAGLDDGDDVGGSSSLWTPSGSNIYYNDGNIGIGTTTPGAKLDISGDIILTGKIKIVRRYYYRKSAKSLGHSSPRCPCDSSSSSLNCDNFYTNTDYGSQCYDWYVYGNNVQQKYIRESGLYVVKTFEYP